MNIIARLEYELAYYDSAVHRFNHYTTRTRWTVKFAFFTNRNLSWADLVFRSSAAKTWGLPPLYSRPEKSKWFPPFCCMEFFCLFRERLWLLSSLGRELSFLLVLCTIKCLFIIIDLICFLPNILCKITFTGMTKCVIRNGVLYTK